MDQANAKICLLKPDLFEYLSGGFYLDWAALQVHGSRLFCPFLRGLRCHHTDEWRASQSGRHITANVTTGQCAHNWGVFYDASKYCVADLSTEIWRKDNADEAVFSEMWSSNFLELFSIGAQRRRQKLKICIISVLIYREHQLRISFNTQIWHSLDLNRCFFEFIISDPGEPK